MKTPAFFGVLILSGTLTAPCIPAATFLVATSGQSGAGQLFQADSSGGAPSLIGNISISGAAVGISGLAVHPQTGVLYGVTTVEGPNFGRSLVSIDPATANAELIGNLNESVLGISPASDISFTSTGVLYGWFQDFNGLGTIDLADGRVTRVGSSASGATIGGGLAFNSSDNLFLSWQGDITGGLRLDRVNHLTGVLAQGPSMTGAPFPEAVNALSFGADGVLYGINSDTGVPSSAAALVSINPDTGAVTSLGGLPSDTDAITDFTPVPETNAFATAFGLLALGFIVYRRTKLAAC